MRRRRKEEEEEEEEEGKRRGRGGGCGEEEDEEKGGMDLGRRYRAKATKQPGISPSRRLPYAKHKRCTQHS